MGLSKLSKKFDEKDVTLKTLSAVKSKEIDIDAIS